LVTVLSMWALWWTKLTLDQLFSYTSAFPSYYSSTNFPFSYAKRKVAKTENLSEKCVSFSGGESESNRSKIILTGKICPYVFLTLSRLDTQSIQLLGYGPDLRGNVSRFSAEVRDLSLLRFVQTLAGVYEAPYSTVKA
jgi:hypothetical protein